MWSYQHQHFTVHQLPVLRDNYIYLIEAHTSDALIVIDPAEAVAVQRACKALEKKLTHIFNTHHHWDHTDGNLQLKAHFDCQIIGAKCDAERIPGIDIQVTQHDAPEIAGLSIQTIEVPGHTSGHIAFVIDDALFCGDTMFGAGCGRLFEGTPAQMWNSLCKLAALDPITKVYCAHEYTMANLEFSRSIDLDNLALTERMHRDGSLRQQNKPTIPSSIAVELVTNPFLRSLDESFCQTYAARYKLSVSDALTVFTDIRLRKDRG
ncbi:hydroxyacylglutathione hydrolase [Mariprofundus sp. EBB-1]|uniref:hydroxyacylglutathione hydrolase n=1 Tax=Mariprofundus sp. EBB-1 TaxID=2650971 RepID=UPI000EF1961E|nr:hydroxyacylglutathione hydrolase [Mariprofundus sp. EBB-1]RLL55025.1 hydroxyacylglutathione hydrolase [Mariprofundus sp. EBB-1]